MSTLVLATYQTNVRRALGNISTTFPQISDGADITAINAAANTIIRRYPEHFPECRNYAWTIGPTVVGDNTKALPTTTDAIPKLLELWRVTSNENDTTPSTTPGDWSETDEHPVPLVAISTIGYASKDSDLDEYPAVCERLGTNLAYWPTTRTGKTCYFRLYGLRGELLIGSGDSFLMDADYDDVVTFEAAATLATSIGWYAKASELRGYVATHMQQLRPAGSGERASRPSRFRIAGMPRT